jgi:hypothetical protein
MAFVSTVETTKEIPQQPMIRRIGALQDLLAKAGMAAAVVWYSRDLLYYTGTCQPS